MPARLRITYVRSVIRGIEKHRRNVRASRGAGAGNDTFYTSLTLTEAPACLAPADAEPAMPRGVKPAN